MLTVLLFVSIVAFARADCNLDTCPPSSNKRCYSIYKSNSSSQTLECRCLKGLYQSNNGTCLGVLRYDLTFRTFMLSVFLDQAKTKTKLKELIKQIINSSNSMVITSKEYDMSFESTTYLANARTWNIYNKLVVWKLNARNVTDLPQITLAQMNTFLSDAFRKQLKYDPALNLTYLGDEILVGEGRVTNDFLDSFNLTYNELTCWTDKYNYCFDHKLCTPYYGSVRCKCDDIVSRDVSPQKDLFEGENCATTCSEPKCFNQGRCLIQNGVGRCFCPRYMVGDRCEIDLVVLGIVAACLFVLMVAAIVISCYLQFKKYKTH